MEYINVSELVKKMSKTRIRLLFFVNVDWFFISHRLPIALKAISEGYEVHLVTTLTGSKKILEDSGLIVHNIKMSRGSNGIISSLMTILEIYKIYIKTKPDIVHLVTIKPVLLGGIAARFANVKNVVVSISGMGYVYINKSFLNFFNRFSTSILYKLALGQKSLKVIFQNESDLELVSKIAKLSRSNTTLIKGSGVDLDLFRYSPLPQGKPLIVLASRLLVDKGVIEFVEAARILKSENFDARFILVGSPDTENNASLTEKDIKVWQEEEVIEYWGHKNEMNKVLSDSSIVVLPSYREGMPKVLLEASAVGRPIITTDVPGCRDAIIPDITGLLVPLKNAVELSRAIKFLLKNRHLWKEMGSKSRKLAEESYGVEGVVKKHMEIYFNLINGVE